MDEPFSALDPEMKADLITELKNLTKEIGSTAVSYTHLDVYKRQPETLYKEGFSTKPPVVYAQGSLIICSSQNVGFDNWERLLLTARINKIAIANPAIAPYGKAADEVLKQKGVLDDVRSKIVTGESISQVNTYILSLIHISFLLI